MNLTNNPEKSKFEPGESQSTVNSEAATGIDQNELYEKVVDVIRTVYDPEIPVNIYEIGLIYNIDIDSSNAVTIRMTLTSPACPSAGTLPGEVEDKVSRLAGVSKARVELVWDPAWSPSLMSEAAKLQLGMF